MTVIEYMTVQKKKLKFLNEGELSANVGEWCASALFQQGIEDYMQLYYAGYRLQFHINASNCNYIVPNACTLVYNVNYYKYNKLWETLGLDYDPIANRNEKFDGMITHGGVDTDTIINGEQKLTNVIGERSTDYSEQPRTDTDTKSVAPFETDTFHAKERLNSEYGLKSGNNRTSTATDVSTAQGYTDTDSTNYGHTIHDEHTLSGLSGEHTVQDLIEKERRLAMFNFYKIVCQDIIKVIAIRQQGVCLTDRERMWIENDIDTLQ